MTYNLLMDVDTGIDDALALMFAFGHPEVSVKAITCVAGNVDVESVVANTFKILDLIGAPDVPVAAGATRPLIEPARNASHVHGNDGLGDSGLPVSARTREPVHAVELLRAQLVAADEPLTIVALAPLTNIALLVRTHPEVLDRIERIVFMGGAVGGGNATAAAEFNIWHDPEAARIVLGSGVPITMYGLDVFEQITIPRDAVDRLRAASDPVSQQLGGLLGFEIADLTTGDSFSLALIGDAGAVCALVAPELFEIKPLRVQVELAPGLSRGQTIVDRRAYAGEDAHHGTGGEVWPEADVVLSADVPAVRELFLGITAS